MYIEMAKGAFVRSRAKWLEQGERNSSYFFALEKRNRKRNNLPTLKINDNITSNSLDISRYVGTFYSNIYKSNIQFDECDRFIESVKAFTPTISEQFKLECERPITKVEISEAVGSMKKGKSPGNDGLSVKFYFHFWEIIENPLFDLFKECILKKEMSTSMKQGLICLLPKPDKDHLLIENWRPIMILNVDYKIVVNCSLVLRMKVDLNFWTFWT